MFVGWREHRRAKRQRVLERAYFQHERARSTGASTGSPSTDLLNASVRSGAYGTIRVTFFNGYGGGQ
jgi:hypothetical protein